MDPNISPWTELVAQLPVVVLVVSVIAWGYRELKMERSAWQEVFREHAKALERVANSLDKLSSVDELSELVARRVLKEMENKQ